VGDDILRFQSVTHPSEEGLYRYKVLNLSNYLATAHIFYPFECSCHSGLSLSPRTRHHNLLPWDELNLSVQSYPFDVLTTNDYSRFEMR
jgi:hypothetical protein